MSLFLSTLAIVSLAQAPAPSVTLPQPTQDPLAIDRSTDPLLALARTSVDEQTFLRLVEAAVLAHPAVAEGQSGISVAEAGRDEARAGLFPTIEVLATTQRSFSREFGNDPDNLVERSRSLGRTDGTLSVQQTVYDFGETESRIAAAGARLRAASFQAESTADQVALRAIAAWYDVFGYRALVRLGDAFVAGQRDLRTAIETRIGQGVSAAGDLPRVDSYVASATANNASYRRQLANAEARFAEIFGEPAPPVLGRAPVLGDMVGKQDAETLARATPAVQAADAEAVAARQDEWAERAATLPNLSAGVDAGKYGLDDVDYDVRGRLTLRVRFFGAGDARADRARALVGAAEARATRIRSEAEREAAIAWSDVGALEEQLGALESSYLASRQSRDVLAERFRVTRGTLFDVLDSESGYFGVAASYLRAIIELDAARYVLLSRTGRLLPTLGISVPMPRNR